jgi:hypothetical protein
MAGEGSVRSVKDSTEPKLCLSDRVYYFSLIFFLVRLSGAGSGRTEGRP